MVKRKIQRRNIVCYEILQAESLLELGNRKQVGLNFINLYLLELVLGYNGPFQYNKFLIFLTFLLIKGIDDLMDIVMSMHYAKLIHTDPSIYPGIQHLDHLTLFVVFDHTSVAPFDDFFVLASEDVEDGLGVTQIYEG